MSPRNAPEDQPRRPNMNTNEYAPADSWMFRGAEDKFVLPEGVPDASKQIMPLSALDLPLIQHATYHVISRLLLWTHSSEPSVLWAATIPTFLQKGAFSREAAGSVRRRLDFASPIVSLTSTHGYVIVATAGPSDNEGRLRIYRLAPSSAGLAPDASLESLPQLTLELGSARSLRKVELVAYESTPNGPPDLLVVDPASPTQLHHLKWESGIRTLSTRDTLLIMPQGRRVVGPLLLANGYPSATEAAGLPLYICDSGTGDIFAYSLNGEQPVIVNRYRRPTLRARHHDPRLFAYALPTSISVLAYCAEDIHPGLRPQSEFFPLLVIASNAHKRVFTYDLRNDEPPLILLGAGGHSPEAGTPRNLCSLKLEDLRRVVGIPRHGLLVLQGPDAPSFFFGLGSTLGSLGIGEGSQPQTDLFKS